MALVSRLDALAGVLPVHGVTRESSVAAAVVAASARRLGADLVRRRVPSGAVDLAALRVQLEEAGAPPPLEQVGVLETAAILLAQIERSLVAHGAVVVPRPVAVSA